MISIMLNSLLIDMFEASKPMEMMWLMVGGVLGAASAVPQDAGKKRLSFASADRRRLPEEAGA